MPKMKPTKRKAEIKLKSNIPPSKKILSTTNDMDLSSDSEGMDDKFDSLMTSPTCDNNHLNFFTENRQDILSIKLQFKRSINELKNNFSVDSTKWVNHLLLFENSFVEFLDTSTTSIPAVPPVAVTIEDVKSLIDLSVSSKFDSLIKSIPLTNSPSMHTNNNSYASITSQGLTVNPGSPKTTLTPVTSPTHSVSPVKKSSQISFFVQLHDSRSEPLSGSQILDLVKSLIDPIALNIRINNVYINKHGKVLFFLDSLMDQTLLFEKLIALQHEVLNLLLITQKQAHSSKIIITNVDNSVSFETISSKLLDHELVKPFLKPGDKITLIRRTKGFGLHSSIICEIPSELKDKFISIQRLWFGFFTAYIKNFVKTKQCYNCAEFGHFKNNCSNSSACLLCSGPHCLFECPSKDSKKSKCINCINSANPMIFHQANSLKCPHYLAHFNSLDGQVQ